MTELYSLISEQSVLGGLLVNPQAHDHIDHLTESDFYEPRHRTIYRHICLMLAQQKPVDVITVAEALASAGEELQTGGLAYLGELAMNTPSAANIHRYAEVVIERRQLRDLLEASGRIADLARESSTLGAAKRIDEAQDIMLVLLEESRRATGKPLPMAILLTGGESVWSCRKAVKASRTSGGADPSFPGNS